MPADKKLPSGPTLNVEYNYLITTYWLAQGSPSSPECEECQKDLTGCEVHEYDNIMWVCSECFDTLLDERPTLPRIFVAAKA